MSFNATDVRIVEAEVRKALESIGKNHDITFDIDFGRHSPTKIQFRITAARTVYSSLGKTLSPAQVEWDWYASRFGFKSDDFGRRFERNGQTFTICGVKPSNHKYPILAKTSSGTVYKFSPAMVVASLPAPPAPATPATPSTSPAPVESRSEEGRGSEPPVTKTPPKNAAADWGAF